MPERPLPALLFDLDGTLIDSDPLHARVYIDLFAERGIEIDVAFYIANVHGRHNSEVFGEYLPDEDPGHMHLVKEAAYRALLARDGAAAIDGAARMVEAAHARGQPLAVVTNAPRANADASLTAIGLKDIFRTVIVGEECSAGKPDPAPYLAALGALGIDAADAIAFEDSPSGLASARAAGIKTIGIRSTLSDAGLRAAGAHASVAHFDDPALAVLIDAHLRS